MKDHNCYLFIVFTTLLSVLQEGKKHQPIQCMRACVRVCVRFSFVRSLTHYFFSPQHLSLDFTIIFIRRREREVYTNTLLIIQTNERMNECMACMHAFMDFQLKRYVSIFICKVVFELWRGVGTR